MWPNLLLLALIGFIAGAVARGAFPGKQPMGILATVALGIVGALLGGLIAWIFWPAEDGLLHAGGFLLSILGAGIVLSVYIVSTRRSRA